MINELSGMAIGLDLCYDYSQITYYNTYNTEPMTVSTEPGKEKYEIPTPKDLFPLVEQKAELGTALLSKHFKECFALLKTAGSLDGMVIMVTMREMKAVWAQAIFDALQMLDIPKKNIFLQEHLESFYYYTLNQKKEYWMYHVALIEYDRESITGWELSINRKTKPALTSVEKCFRIYLNTKARDGRNDAEWDSHRDNLLLKNLRSMIEENACSCAFLIGQEFERKWCVKSLSYLCRKRRVFQGRNLYSKGACFGAMEKTGVSVLKDYLYSGKDMVEHNLGMQMNVRGQDMYYPLVNAGINWYMADHTCEFLLNDTDVLLIYSRSINGEELEHEIQLGDLPKRPARATRLRMKINFTSKNRFKVLVEDLGLGEFYPSSGKTWNSVIKLP